MGILIKGTGKYAPCLTITNDDMATIVDTNDEWITTRTGIKSRHITDGVLNYEMGAFAAEAALAQSGLDKSDIGMVIASTVTGDFISPSLAAMVANKVGLTSAVVIDINCACAGFVYALDIAKLYMSTGDYKNIMIVCSEQLSKITNYDDRSTCVLFGDGAAACIVGENDGMYASYLASEPQGCESLFAQSHLPNNPFMKNIPDHSEEKMFSKKPFVLYMDGQDVYKFATRVMPLAIRGACEKAGISVEDLDLIIPHQANIRIIETSARNLKLPMEKFFVNIDNYGNTSSASVPICLAEAAEKGIIKRGDKIAFVGFGAGLTYGASVLEY